MKRKGLIVVEHVNGERFNLSKWCRDVLKTQDLDAWYAENPNEYRRNVEAWVKGQLIVAIENLEVVLKEVQS